MTGARFGSRWSQHYLLLLHPADLKGLSDLSQVETLCALDLEGSFDLIRLKIIVIPAIEPRRVDSSHLTMALWSAEKIVNLHAVDI